MRMNAVASGDCIWLIRDPVLRKCEIPPPALVADSELDTGRMAHSR